MVRATAGTFVLIPRGTVHTFANPLATPSKFLLIASPAGFEHTLRNWPRWWKSTAIRHPKLCKGLPRNTTSGWCCLPRSNPIRERCLPCCDQGHDS